MKVARTSQVSGATVFPRAVAAEWTRLWSVRSTWWSLLAGATIMLLMAIALGLDTAGDPPLPVWLAAELAIVPGQFAFLLIVILSVTAEYSNGAIRSSLQWVPRRGVLFFARSLVAVTVTTTAALVVSAATDLVAGVLMGDSALVVVDDIAASIGRIGLYVASASVFSIGLAWSTRNTAAALTAVFLLQLVLPVMLPSFGVDLLATIGENLPGYANAGLLEALGLDVATTAIVSVLGVWLAASVGAGAWSLMRRDAA